MKFIIISSLVAVILIGGSIFLANKSDDGLGGTADNVKIVNGVQIIDLRAKGGYTPKISTAKAGIPTILRVNTSGTFDCSSSLRIPSMKIAKNLQPTGKTEIDLGTPEVGAVQGTCSMGMYPFIINFES